MKSSVAAFVLLALALAPSVSLACTATDTVDLAKAARDTEQYRSARDVSEEFVDVEKFTKDESTVEAGVGTLLMEQNNPVYALSVPNNGRTPGDWRSVLDVTTRAPHGTDSDWKEIQLVTENGNWKPVKPISVRDHMRKHVKEWHDALASGDAYLTKYWSDLQANTTFAERASSTEYRNLMRRQGASGTSSGPAPAPVGTVRPTPAPVSATAAPVAPVVPAAPPVDHAG